MEETILSKRTDFDEIPRSETTVIITFRPGINDILDVVEKGKSVKTIKVSKSVFPSIGAIPMRVAKSHGIEIIENEKNMRGKRTDKRSV